MQGQSVGRKPVFDNMCAYCGELLHGSMNEAGSNKVNGKPVTIGGRPASGDAQPPFLLRWPPEVIAEMAPAASAWSERTNKLELREEFQDTPP